MLWWTLQNLAVTALLAGFVALACRLCRVGPVGRHALWLLVLVKMLTPPLVVWPWAVRPPPSIAGGDESGAVAVARRTVAVASGVAGPTASPPAIKVLPSPDTGPEGPALPSPADAGPEPEPDGSAAVPPLDLPVEPVESAPSELPGGRSAHDAISSRPANETADSPAPRILQRSSFRPVRLLPWAGGTWLGGGLLLALVQGARIVHMSRSARRGRPADLALAGRVGELSRRLGIRPVPVRVVPGLVSPVIWAAAGPRLLWPEGLPAGVSDESVSGLIVHELAHVKRRDHWVGWLELAAGCLWWWNPLFWYVRHQLRENAELACDAWVVNTLPGGRGAYARALLAVCECLSGISPGSSGRLMRTERSAPMPAVGVGTGGRRFIERRLTMILRERVPLRLPRVGLIVVALLATAALPAWAQKKVNRGADGPYTTVEDAGAGGGSESSGRFNVTTTVPGPGERGYIRRLGATLTPEPALPDDAGRLLREFEAGVARQRQEVIGQLQDLQARYTRAGQLDEAVAVRDALRRLEAGRVRPTGISSKARTATADPGTLTEYRDRVGLVLYFDVVGSTAGTIWGTEVYSDDSPLATAAVHAGVLQSGERGVVRVRILPALHHYEGSTSNGVTSSPYGEWYGSYLVESVKPPAVSPFSSRSGSPYAPSGRGGPDAPPGSRAATATDAGTALPDPGTLTSYRDRVGQSFNFELTGSTDSTIWGDGLYTDDSPPAVAAVHAGALRAGQKGVIRVTIHPGRDSYSESTRNGVTSSSYGSFGGSYTIEPVSARSSDASPTDSAPGASALQPPTLHDDTGSPGPTGLTGERLGNPGEVLTREVVGATDGPVWGTDVYSDDSDIATAAVHAGLLRPGEKGIVHVRLLPGRDEYDGSTRNGVTSRPWTTYWGGSFRLAAPPTPSKVGEKPSTGEDVESLSVEKSR